MAGVENCLRTYLKPRTDMEMIKLFPPVSVSPISHKQPLVQLGSCFSTHISEKLRRAGFQVCGAACVVDRQEGARELLAASGVKLVSLFTIDDLRTAPDEV